MELDREGKDGLRSAPGLRGLRFTPGGANRAWSARAWTAMRGAASKRTHTRHLKPVGALLLVAVLAILGFASAATPAFAAEGEHEGFGVDKWEAGTCIEADCKDSDAPAEFASKFYTQAAGHPEFGITDFRINSQQSTGLAGAVHVPEGAVDNVRVDLPEGLAVDPEAAAECSQAELEESKCPAGSQVGEDEAEGTVNVQKEVLEEILTKLGLPHLVGGVGGVGGLEDLTVTEKFPVYNMQRLPGEPARFGVEVKSATLTLAGIETQIYLEGGISWHEEPELADGENSHVVSGNFHEYFKIPDVSEAPQIVESKLIFWGRPHEHDEAAPEKTFITMPSTCTGPQTTLLHISDHAAPEDFVFKENTTPIGAEGCGSLVDRPELEQKPETARSDAADGTEVILDVPQGTDSPSTPNSPDVKTATVTLPEGMTLDPSAANGLEACTDEEIGINATTGLASDRPIGPSGCPAGSIIGTVRVNAPGIPNGSLTGDVYLGTPKAKTTQNPGEAESGEEYRIFVDAYTEQYGVGLRLEGHVSANESTGRLTATFSDLPEVPFESFDLKFNGGSKAPLANPLTCGAATISGSIAPFTGEPPATPSSFFAPEASGGGSCTGVPFAPSQETSATPATAGSNSTAFTLSLTRPEGQQYLSQVSAALPEGLVGKIPAVPLCGEPQAAAGSCSAESKIGTASVAVGSGPQPFALAGTVYLTGPYNGAPYGLSIVVPATKVGPFDYGNIVTRAKIDIEPYTARVLVSSSLPTIVGGAPLRLRSVSIAVDRPGFLLNPTSCEALATGTTLTSTLGATTTVSTPFQASGCSSLAFEPKLAATARGKTSRRNGAALTVTVTAPANEANIHAVDVTLPKKLVARLNTLNHACLLETFDANPASCPQESKVGTATVATPVLPSKLTGSAYFVSLGHAGFPNLDIVLKADGVTVILVGSTNIKGAYTHSNFASLPDVPFSSFQLTLPEGLDSALSTNGDLCKNKSQLRMPTTIVGQNGKKLTQRTKIKVTGCAAPKKKKRRKQRRKHDHKGAKKHGRGGHEKRA